MGKGRRAGAGATADKHALYQQAVQYAPGDVHWLCLWHKQYVGGKAPHHLREDFCGTALISSTWCKQSVQHTATGVDIDREVLRWGLVHNTDGCRERLCLIEANVLLPPSTGKIMQHAKQQAPQQLQQQHGAAGSKEVVVGGFEAASVSGGPSFIQRQQQQQRGQQALLLDHRSPSARAADVALEADEAGDALASSDLAGELGETAADSLALTPPDVVCAFNFSVCLLHKREEVLRYFQQVRGCLCRDPGGIFVLDLMGGHAVEQAVVVKRRNFKTGLRFTFEQERYNPLTRVLRSHITLQDPVTKQVLKRAFSYCWRLWSVADVAELLKQAGFSSVHVWAKPLDASSRSSSAGGPRHSDGGSSSAGEDDGEDGGDSSCSSSDGSDGGDEPATLTELTPATTTPAVLARLSHGWTAYVVAVAAPSPAEGAADEQQLQWGPGV